MPRKPSFSHPLNKIRETAGLTQEQLAKRLGVSKSTVQSIEIGRMSLSRELATKIVRQMGCVLTCNTDEKGKESYSVSNRSNQTLETYTKEDFIAHTALIKTIDSGSIDAVCESAARCLDLIFRAAQRGSGGTVLSIRDDFESFASKIFSDYDLARHLKGLLQEEWLPDNEFLEVDRVVANFPLAPLNTVSSFPTVAEIRLNNTSGSPTDQPDDRIQKVMPK